VADSPRIEELKRRVQSDPASIAFAALAEEYRRAERFEEAIEACKAGLVRHPSYLSAHVTLGRAYIEVGKLQDARQELEYVLKLAPENLAAIRGLAEIHHRLGDEGGEEHDDASTPQPQPALALASSNRELTSNAESRTEQAEATSTAAVPSPPVIEARPEPTLAGTKRSSDVSPFQPAESLAHVTYPQPVDPALAGLEEFLNAIIRARAERPAAR